MKPRMTASLLLLLLLPVLGACSVLMPPKRYDVNRANDGSAVQYGPAQRYDYSIERGLTPTPGV